MTTALVTVDQDRKALALQPDFGRQIEEALAGAAMIGVVSNEIQNANLCEWQKALRVAYERLEEARKQAKEPFFDWCRKIDRFFNRHKDELLSELTRLGRVGGDYQAVLDQRKRAEEAKKKAEEDEIQRRKNEELAKVETIEEATQIHERAAQAVMALQPPPAAPKPKGQTRKDDWEIEVENPLLLATMHPTCVRIEPKIIEIKALLRAGHTVSGIRATPTTATGVRISKKVIEA